MKPYLITLLFITILNLPSGYSQTPGIIVRPAGSNGPAVLDPNADAYTSATTAGFSTDDIASSEIPYKLVPPPIPEPTGDLLRGPSGKFSDIVKKLDGSGFYLYNDGTNFLCRLRIGGIVSGSKGYSILLDTDSKFGNTGSYADPNYMAVTNGNNGNPGFELEIVLETNFRVAVYNVDGTSTPVLLSSYTIATNSQISVAATTDGSDADYFYDFYVPFSALGISASTPIRATATTVMSPGPAIGGPKSDIYGVSGSDYMADWTTGILSQPPFTFTGISSGGSGVGAVCTNPPVLNGPIIPTATTVTGTWTKASFSALTSATITLYKGAVSIGTTTVSSGGAWSITVSGLSNNDIITAKAQAAGESACLASNSVIVNACNSSNSPATPILTCTSGSKGVGGTNLSTGWTIHVNNITRATVNNSVTNTGALFGANSGSSPAITWQYSGGCASGAPLASGSYKIYYTNNATGCASQPAYFCAAGNGGSALAGALTAPTITSPSNGVYTPATTSVVGTTTANATLFLYLNGVMVQTTTASAGGVFTFSNLVLKTTDQLYIVAELNTGTVTTSYCAGKTATFTVACFTNPPLITVGNSNQLTTGSPITGTSTEATGTLIRIYTAANVLVATTAVQSGGSWSTANAGTTPAVYNAVAATSYYANAQNGTCGLSSNSATFATASNTSAARCGTLPATVSENATSVSGTLSGTALAGTVVTLYADGTSIGTYTTSNLAWGGIPVNTTVNNTLYTGAVLTIGITEPSKNEVMCGASVTVSCASPSSPSVNPTTSVILIGQTVTYTVSSPTTGILYSIRDNTDAINMGNSKFGSGSAITLVTNAFNTVGTYNLNLKATSFSGTNCQSLRAATVYVTSSVLAVNLLKFEGKLDKGIAALQWTTLPGQTVEFFEIQKSYTGDNYKTVVTIAANSNNNFSNSYFHNDSSALSPVYYRLKMSDKTSISFSKVILLQTDKKFAVTSVSPNPFTSAINISVHYIQDEPVLISLSDMAGRKIKKMTYAAKAGLNIITLQALHYLAKGTYIVELIGSNGNIARRKVIRQ